MIDRSYLHPTTSRQIKAILAVPAHGYLFYGPKYLYKHRTAKEVAAELSQANSTEDVNIITIDSESGGHIKLKQIQTVLDQLSRTALRRNRRVVIINNAHYMTNDASNALLKILEEPPEDVIFILVSDRVQQLLPTIRSRLQEVSFVPQGRLNAKNAETLPPRLRDELSQDDKLKKQYDELILDVAGYIGGTITQRFLIAKRVSDNKLVDNFIELLELQLATTARSKPGLYKWLEKLILVEDQLAHNINPRLCLEGLALGVAQ